MKFEQTAKRMKQALARADMNAKELSIKTGVSEASISQYANGYHKPSNISAGKIAPILGVNPLWLMGFDSPMLIESEQSNTAPTLTADENTLLTDYRKLNEAGKNQALRQVADLTEIEKYTARGDGSAGLKGEAG